MISADGTSNAEGEKQGAAWAFPKLLRFRHAQARLPPGSALSEPPDGICPETASAALEEVRKRLDAQLAAKGTTETRALTLSGYVVTALVALTGGAVIEALSNEPRWVLVVGAGVGAAVLFCALVSTFIATRAGHGTLPGRLPDEVWDDLIAPNMKGPEFKARLIQSLQDAMVRNEEAQESRADWLNRSLSFSLAAVPLAVGAMLVSAWLLSAASQPRPSTLPPSPPAAESAPAAAQ